ncbi:hypothetical protein [Methylorubrum extorquens]|uniref:hypothetical protein n=1 Tax=Methylorubrum extorquens TaxID=408 RepID=UPI00209EA080|nr:hypothetical protein [Methylorubrum extorquens]MCP1539977.1 hypothetical protein [Methylorubrum extorquens]
MRSLPKPNPFTDFSDLEPGRNPRYLDSLLLGLERGVWRAPTSLLTLAGWPVCAVLMSIAYLLIGIVLWFVCRLYFVTLGVLGLLRKKAGRPDKSALTQQVVEEGQ